jgi:hypothetical protein
MNDETRIDNVGRALAIVLSPVLAVAYIGYWLFAVLPLYCRQLFAVHLASDVAAGSMPSDDTAHFHSGFDHGGGHDASGHC